uniref:Kinase n=1 Tax=Megaselia scalaris TaxID=36166 RepID=T1GV61_MEGSC
MSFDSHLTVVRHRCLFYDNRRNLQYDVKMIYKWCRFNANADNEDIVSKSTGNLYKGLKHLYQFVDSKNVVGVTAALVFYWEYMSKINHFNSDPYDFLKLESLTRGIQLPCVMDIKIGQRTWDPLADEEKIKSEESKYFECKQGLGFCIPGFQVYDIEDFVPEVEGYPLSIFDVLFPGGGVMSSFTYHA